jgi:hypothetical protein
VTASGHLAVTGSTGIVDAPLVDSTPATPVVYVFVGDELLSAASAVFQFSTGFAATSTGIKEVLNSGHSGGTTTILYDGDFDNIHYSGNGTTGNLYVCTSHNGGTEPQLFSIPMNAGFTLTPVQGPVLTSAAAACSPVTEVDGNVHDWIFLSVTASGNASGCTGACLYNYNVDSALAIGSVPAAGLAVTGGASGIIIDNTSTSTGASQIYFTPLGGGICTGNGATGAGTGGCAVQASQSGLN